MISARRAREADLDKACSRRCEAGRNLSVLSGTFQSRSWPINRARQCVGLRLAQGRPSGNGSCKAATFRATAGQSFAWGNRQMTIELHTWNTPNGRKISVALEEMGLPYKVIPVNISKGEQMAPDFLKISPNNKIPAIVDPDGPGGKPVGIFESG